MPYTLKSCNRRHAWCGRCNADAQDSLSDAMIGNVNGLRDIDSGTKRELSDALMGRRHLPSSRQELIAKARDNAT
jgi:hypothetical protein